MVTILLSQKTGFPCVTSVTHNVTDGWKKIELLGTDALTTLNFLELDRHMRVKFSKNFL